MRLRFPSFCLSFSNPFPLASLQGLPYLPSKPLMVLHPWLLLPPDLPSLSQMHPHLPARVGNFPPGREGESIAGSETWIPVSSDHCSDRPVGMMWEGWLRWASLTSAPWLPCSAEPHRGGPPAASLRWSAAVCRSLVSASPRTRDWAQYWGEDRGEGVLPDATILSVGLLVLRPGLHCAHALVVAVLVRWSAM